jgi:hypothetical protein
MRLSAIPLAPAIATAAIAAGRLDRASFPSWASRRRRSVSPAKPGSFVLKAANGGDAVRNRCANCMSLVFGGEIGESDSYTLYAGSLDDPSAFHPTIAIFTEGRPPWALIPPDFKVFDRMPS